MGEFMHFLGSFWRVCAGFINFQSVFRAFRVGRELDFLKKLDFHAPEGTSHMGSKKEGSRNHGPHSVQRKGRT